MLSQWRYWPVWVGSLYTEASNVFSDPWETKVCKKGMDPSLLGTSMMNCMCGSMELMCCKNCWLYSACWITIHIFKPKPGWIGGSADGLGFKLLHEQVGYNGTYGRTHCCAMHLFIMQVLTLEEEVGLFQSELQ